MIRKLRFTLCYRDAAKHMKSQYKCSKTSLYCIFAFLERHVKSMREHSKQNKLFQGRFFNRGRAWVIETEGRPTKEWPRAEKYIKLMLFYIFWWVAFWPSIACNEKQCYKMTNQFKMQKLFKIDDCWALQKNPYLGVVSFNIHLNVGANWRIRHWMRELTQCEQRYLVLKRGRSSYRRTRSYTATGQCTAYHWKRFTKSQVIFLLNTSL